MAKTESINVRVTLEEKNQLGARTYEAGLFTISDYVRQVLFMHDTGEDMRAAWVDAVKEMKQEREAMRGEWQAARESIEEGLSKLMQKGEAGNAEMMRALDAFLEKAQGEKNSALPDRRQGEKYIADSWLYPCGLLIAFCGGVVFF